MLALPALGSIDGAGRSLLKSLNKGNSRPVPSTAHRMPELAAADDDRDLTLAGYPPQFRRGLGSFAAFAAGFSYLSILTGIVQNFHVGYREAGPAFFWTWPVVFAGQFCLALC